MTVQHSPSTYSHNSKEVSVYHVSCIRDTINDSHYRREVRPTLDESGKYGNYAPQQFEIITNVDINEHHSIHRLEETDYPW